MKKTKIICTIGPASTDINIIENMIKSGMNIARLNFSHGTYEKHKENFNTIRKVSKKLNTLTGILQDLQGPKVRIGKFKPEEKDVILQQGKKFILTTENYIGDENKVNVDYELLHKYISVNDKIFIDDGKIELKVKKIENRNIETEVIIGGKISDNKGVSLPNKILPLPVTTHQDLIDLDYGMKLGVDYIAVSFTRKKENIVHIKSILKSKRRDYISVIAKIEDIEGISNIDSIIEVSDGIMIARGDMGVSLPRAEVPLIQKNIIRKCREKGKPVIVATQMLDSMTNNLHPTRAEVNDVANSILDGADCLMLSGETAVGSYPVESVCEMYNIIKTIEKSTEYKNVITLEHHNPAPSNIVHGLGVAIDKLSEVSNLKAIICFTKTGYTAKIISQYRPELPIITLTPNKIAAQQLILYSGLDILVLENQINIENNTSKIIKLLQKQKKIKKGDRVIITSGVNSKPFGASIKIIEV